MSAVDNTKVPVDSKLSARQREVLQYIAFSLRSRGYPPSMREIGDRVGLTSPSSVKYQLNALEDKGYIRRDPNRPRAIELVDRDGSESERSHVNSGASVDAPLLGQIAAGTPILAEENVEDIFSLPHQLVGHGDLFVLRVSGDSMQDAGILDGDYVVVRQQPSAENGEIVAAQIEDECTVKVLRRDSRNTWLLPRNDSYEPIDGNNAVILGRVVSVLRTVRY